jgi:hypothetical protein
MRACVRSSFSILPHLVAQAIGQLKPEDILFAAFDVLQKKLDMLLEETA